MKGLSKLRAARVSLFGGRYVVADRVDRAVCVYCGATATGVDHVPPLVAVAFYPDFWPAVEYPSCGRCNVALGVFPETCLENRAVLLVLASRAASDDEIRRGGDGTAGKAWSLAVSDRMAGLWALCACRQCDMHRQVAEQLRGRAGT